MSEPPFAPNAWPDVKRWRAAERLRLLKARLDGRHVSRAARDARITEHVLERLDPDRTAVVGCYWPYRGEIDTRPLMRELIAHGASVALPAVVRRGHPLEYRRWYPGVTLESNALGIPVPAERQVLHPDVVLAPLLGFDDENFRLGLGGGYFDRTLAALDPMPRTIGMGIEIARLPTIYPQPHDVPLDLIITEKRARFRTPSPLRRPVEE